jgi:hypothetical protein
MQYKNRRSGVWPLIPLLLFVFGTVVLVSCVYGFFKFGWGGGGGGAGSGSGGSGGDKGSETKPIPLVPPVLQANVVKVCAEGVFWEGEKGPVDVVLGKIEKQFLINKKMVQIEISDDAKRSLVEAVTEGLQSRGVACALIR